MVLSAFWALITPALQKSRSWICKNSAIHETNVTMMISFQNSRNVASDSPEGAAISCGNSLNSCEFSYKNYATLRISLAVLRF